MNKTQILEHVINIEGGYVDNPADSGGPTKYGITEATARRYGYTGDIQNLSKQTAFEVYELMYWLPVHGDDLEAISSELVLEVVDTAVNMGVRRASLFLQRALNTFNDGGTMYCDLLNDGRIGPQTLSALHAFEAFRQKEGVQVLIRLLNCLQGAFYVELAEKREKDETFIYGWIKNRVVI